MWYVDTINAALKKSGMTAAEASRLATGNAAFIKNMRKGSEPGIERLRKLCIVLGVDLKLDILEATQTAEDIHPIPEVEWRGEIAAGGGADPDDCCLYMADEFTGETVSPPPALRPDQAHQHGGLFAVTVRGDSMTPTYRDGDSIYMYKDDPARFDLSRLIGQDCAITMGPDQGFNVFLKRLRWPDNQEKGYFNLESLNPRFPTMTNIQLQAALPVRYVKRNV